MTYRLPIGRFVEGVIDWLTLNGADFFDSIRLALLWVIKIFNQTFQAVPVVLMIVIFAALAYWFSGRGVAVFTGGGLALIYFIGLWKATMQTLAQVATATCLALLIGVPLGIWMSRSARANKIVHPILDFMQTMPAFVYLIPAVYFFGLGEVPGVVATVIFAMPPVVRLTNLGIRQVPQDVVEAARAFGATGRQRLFKVEIPLAMPTVMAGLNQTIMLSLSMVVISSMIGAEGLGIPVLKGIQQLKVGDGFEGGLAVVVLAMVLDRITQGMGKPNARAKKLFKKQA